MTVQGEGKGNKSLEVRASRIPSHAEDPSVNHKPSREEDQAARI
jgi:hypothetical protein